MFAPCHAPHGAIRMATLRTTLDFSATPRTVQARRRFPRCTTHHACQRRGRSLRPFDSIHPIKSIHPINVRMGLGRPSTGCACGPLNRIAQPCSKQQHLASSRPGLGERESDSRPASSTRGTWYLLARHTCAGRPRGVKFRRVDAPIPSCRDVLCVLGRAQTLSRCFFRNGRKTERHNKPWWMMRAKAAARLDQARPAGCGAGA